MSIYMYICIYIILVYMWAVYVASQEPVRQSGRGDLQVH